jgi:hypothetical protein
MAKYGSASVVITFDDAPGGTPRIITPYVLTIGGLKIESITQQSNPFGTSNESNTPVGVTKVPDVPIGGLFDDVVTLGPHVVFKVTAADIAPASVGRVLVVNTGGGIFTITVHLVSYEVIAKNGALTEYAALVRQKSAGVWT